MQSPRRDVTLLLTGAAFMAAGYSIARVQADGAPTAQPLWYSGTVSDAQGAPLTGNHQVTVRLFNTEEPTAQSLCVVGPKDVGFERGRFRVDVSQCESKQQIAAVFASKADLYLELTIDDSNKPFMRAKIGAVPFAIEAQHAVSSSQAIVASGATGSLEERLKSIESAMHIKEVTWDYLCMTDTDTGGFSQTCLSSSTSGSSSVIGACLVAARRACANRGYVSGFYTGECGSCGATSGCAGRSIACIR